MPWCVEIYGRKNTKESGVFVLPWLGTWLEISLEFAFSANFEFSHHAA